MQDAKKQPFIKKAAPVGLGSKQSFAAAIPKVCYAGLCSHLVLALRY